MAIIRATTSAGCNSSRSRNQPSARSRVSNTRSPHTQLAAVSCSSPARLAVARLARSCERPIISPFVRPCAACCVLLTGRARCMHAGVCGEVARSVANVETSEGRSSVKAPVKITARELPPGTIAGACSSDGLIRSYGQLPTRHLLPVLDQPELPRVSPDHHARSPLASYGLATASRRPTRPRAIYCASDHTCARDRQQGDLTGNFLTGC